MDRNSSVEALRDMLDQSEFQEMISLYEGLATPSPEEDYWGSFALYAMGRIDEAKRGFERALAEGYRGSAALLSCLYQEIGDTSRATFVLEQIEPFDELSPWDRVIAYREQGKLFEAKGEFTAARDAYKISWNIANESPEFQILLGSSGQLLAWSYEILGQSKYALEVTQKLKRYTKANRRVQLLYMEAICASHIKQFEVTREALTELRTFIPNNPHLLGLIHQAQGVFAYLDGRTEDVFQHFKDAIDAFEGTKTDARFVANLYLGNCALLMNDIEWARMYYERAENELISVGPYLSPGYLKRAQAELNLRSGAFDVSLGKKSAPKNLDRALEIFEELELPMGQMQVWLQLAAWNALKGHEEAVEGCLSEAFELRKRVQDIATFERELDFIPSIKERVLEQLSKEWLTEGPKEVKPAPTDPLADELCALVFNEKYTEAVDSARSFVVTKPSARVWSGLAQLLQEATVQAKEEWNIRPEMRRAKKRFGRTAEMRQAEELLEQLNQLTELAEMVEKNRKAPLQFTSSGQLFLVKAAKTKLEWKPATFANPKTGELLALLVENFKSAADRTTPLEGVLENIWGALSNEHALVQFNEAALELSELGKKLPNSEFAVQCWEDSCGIKRDKVRDRNDASELGIAYWPFEVERYLGMSDAHDAWALLQYEPFFAGSDSIWTNSRRKKLEGALLERGLALYKKFKAREQDRTSMVLAKRLAPLEPDDLIWASDEGKEIKEIGLMLSENAHAGPGEVQLQAEARFDGEERFRQRQEQWLSQGWIAICEELNAQRSALSLERSKAVDPDPNLFGHGLDVGFDSPEIDVPETARQATQTQVQKAKSDKPLKLKLRVISTKFIFEHEREAELEKLRTLLAEHGITNLEEIK